jgi:L-ascorbate metabolism protein UlaG (beta-lactamase superfamily)
MNDINSERAGPSASLTWYGQAGFRLAAGNSRVLVDPFLTGRPVIIDSRFR